MMHKWQNVEITEENTEQFRSYYIPYSDKNSAMENIKQKSLYYKSLNGNWNFIYYDKYLDVPEDIATEEAFNYDRSEISVPSPWQLFGYDNIVYSQRKLEFAYEPPIVPNENPTGVYSRAFIFPEKWNNKEIYVNFDGMSSCFYLYINGLYVGYAEGSYIGREFNITKYLNNGENFITVIALKYSTSSYSENTDGYRFSGILRDVYLLAREKNHIKDVSINTDINGTVNISLSDSCDCEVNLYDSDGNFIISDTTENGKAKLKIDNPLIWTAETPHLYKLLLKSECEYIPFEIGFVKYDKIKPISVNGKKITLKSVSFNEFDCDLGYYTPHSKCFEQLTLMKQSGINAVYCHNIPYSPELSSLCSKIGLYIIYPSFEYASYLDVRDKNSPCIIGNFAITSDIPKWCDESIAVEDANGNISYSADTDLEIIKGVRTLSGLTLNGIPKKELEIHRNLFKPFAIELINNNQVKIKNLYDFIKEFNITFEIMCDGKKISEKNKHFSIAPKHSKIYNLDVSLPHSCRYGCYLNIYIDTFHYSIKMDVPQKSISDCKEIHFLEAEQDKERIIVFGNDFTYVFNTFYGCFTSFVKDGCEFIHSSGFDLTETEKLNVYGYEVAECNDSVISLIVNYSIADENEPPKKRFSTIYTINANGNIDVSVENEIFKISFDKQYKFIEYFENGYFINNTFKNSHSANVCRSEKHTSEYIFIKSAMERGIKIYGDFSFCTEKLSDTNNIYIHSEKLTLQFNI